MIIPTKTKDRMRGLHDVWQGISQAYRYSIKKWTRELHVIVITGFIWRSTTVYLHPVFFESKNINMFLVRHLPIFRFTRCPLNFAKAIIILNIIKNSTGLKFKKLQMRGRGIRQTSSICISTAFIVFWGRPFHQPHQPALMSFRKYTQLHLYYSFPMT